MSKWRARKWQDKAAETAADIAAALQTVFDALNQGQKKKIVKNEKVKALFDFHGVKYGESEANTSE